MNVSIHRRPTKYVHSVFSVVVEWLKAPSAVLVSGHHATRLRHPTEDRKQTEETRERDRREEDSKMREKKQKGDRREKESSRLKETGDRCCYTVGTAASQRTEVCKVLSERFTTDEVSK